MTLAICWPHDPGENRGQSPATGPMTLANSWPHHPGENAADWPHDPGDRHFRKSGASTSRATILGTNPRFRPGLKELAEAQAGSCTGRSYEPADSEDVEADIARGGAGEARLFAILLPSTASLRGSRRSREGGSGSCRSPRNLSNVLRSLGFQAPRCKFNPCPTPLPNRR
jgi:hypothetical protein